MMLRVKKSDLGKHSLNLTILIVVALVTFSRFTTAPADAAANGQDITYAEPGWNFYEWFLRSSILESGTVPLWLRYRFSGYIYAGDPQVSTYYISTIVSLLSLNEHLAIRYNIVLHAIMSGLFMYFLLNVWKQRPEASTIGSIGYMLSGFFIARVFAGHLPMIYAYPWMPLVLASFELAHERDSAKYAMLTAISLSMQILSGGFVIFLYTSLLLGIYAAHKWLVRIVSHHDNPMTVLKQVGQIGKWLVMTAIFTLGISAIKIMPVVDEMVYAGRGTFLKTSTVLEGYVSSRNQLLELFTYKGHGAEAYPYYDFPRWGVWDWWEYWSYVGLITVILAVLGISRVRRNPTPAFLVLSTVISVFLARGMFIAPLVQLMPFFALLRIPSRFLVITQLTIPALATIAVTAIEEFIEDRAKRNRYTANLQLGHVGKLVAYGLALVLIMDLSPNATSLIWTVGGEQTVTPAMQFMRSAPSSQVYRVHLVQPALISDYAKVLDYARNGFEVTRGLGSEFAIQTYQRYLDAIGPGTYKMLGPLNTKYVISNSEIPNLEGLQLERAFPDGTYLYLNTFYIGRLWTTYRAILVAGEDQAFWENKTIELLQNPSFNPQKALLLRGRFVDDFTIGALRKFDVICLPSLTSPPARSQLKAKELLTQYTESGGAVVEDGQLISETLWASLNSGELPPQPTITRYQLNGLEASLILDKPAFLFISEVFISGWRLYVNGQETGIHEMNDIFFGTSLSEGRYNLRVEFNPTSFQMGSMITVASFIALTSLIILDLWRLPLRTLRQRIQRKRLHQDKRQ